MENGLKKVIELARKYAETGSYAIMREIEEIAFENDIFVSEDEEKIFVEDEYFLLEF